jgi:putative permease
MKMSHSQPFNIKLVYTLLSLVIIGYIAIEGKKLLSPLIFACLFSILLLPLARFFEKKCHFRRNFASVTSVLIMMAFIAGIIYFMSSQVSGMGKDWPAFKEQLENSTSNVQDWVSQKFHIDSNKQINYFHKATTKIMDSGTMVAGATLHSVSSALIFLAFTFIYTFFFLLYRGLILKFFERVFLEENSDLVHDIIEEVQFIVRKYITGLLIEMVVVSSFISIVLSVMGIKYAILLGMIAGLFNVIPYIGILTATVISALITFANTAALTKVIWVVAIFLGTHVIDANVLLPLIVGSKVKINAMITLMGVIIGEMIWGIAGTFLSIPIIAVLKIIFDRIESLKPWGLILGDEDATVKPAMQKEKGNNSSLEEKIKPEESK